MTPFFFLPDDYMPKVIRSIARLVYYSNGGFGYSEVYHRMPIYHRNFIIREISKIKKKEKREAEKSRNTSGSGSVPQSPPSFPGSQKGSNPEAQKFQQAIDQIRKQSSS